MKLSILAKFRWWHYLAASAVCFFVACAVENENPLVMLDFGPPLVLTTPPIAAGGHLHAVAVTRPTVAAPLALSSR